MVTTLSGETYLLRKGWIAKGTNINAALVKEYPDLRRGESFELFESATNSAVADGAYDMERAEAAVAFSKKKEGGGDDGVVEFTLMYVAAAKEKSRGYSKRTAKVAPWSGQSESTEQDTTLPLPSLSVAGQHEFLMPPLVLPQQ